MSNHTKSLRKEEERRLRLIQSLRKKLVTKGNTYNISIILSAIEKSRNRIDAIRHELS